MRVSHVNKYRQQQPKSMKIEMWKIRYMSWKKLN